MLEKLIILVICLILLSVSAEIKASNIATYNDDVTIVTHEKIVGGHAVSITDYPYQLSLQLNYMHICGASIIADKWALTAAHCTYSVPSSNLSVRAGTSFRGYGGQIIDIKRVHEHPKYHPDKLDYDISVLELLEPVNINSAKRIHMASWYNFLFPWLEGVVTGWGHSKENGTLTWQLQAVKLPVINHYRCSLAYGGVVSGNMFCAGYPAGKKDSCQGDSGGPLAINGRLYGIVSFGMGCARPGYPGVYVRVSEFRGFIYSVCGV